MTNGPYWNTGSPIGRPCSIRSSDSAFPFSRTISASGRSRMQTPDSILREPNLRESPRKKYKVRLLPLFAAGRFHLARGANRRVQMATSESGRDAQECGGGEGALASP